MFDSNEVVRAYLASQATLTAVVGTRIQCPRLNPNTTLPAISFFGNGGPKPNPHIPDIVKSRKQFDCWASSLKQARQVYGLLYDVLQGVNNQTVLVGVTPYYLRSAEEEFPGQDLVDEDIPNYYRVLTFFYIEIRA